MSNKKLLIVEDEKPLVKVLEIFLKEKPVDLEIATDGELAWEKLADFKPDLILLDLWLPKINGIEFLKKVKADDHYKEIPVVIFSNMSMDSGGKKALELGAAEYIDKSSVTTDALAEKVLEYLGME